MQRNKLIYCILLESINNTIQQKQKEMFERLEILYSILKQTLTNV